MNEEIQKLIEQGLHEGNLRKLAQMCREQRAQAPAVYGTLAFMFDSFAEEYDNQGIDVDRYSLILATIKEPILLLLEVEEDPAVVLDRLDAVFRAFATLKG